MLDTFAVKLLSFDNLLQVNKNILYEEQFFMFPFSLIGCSMNNHFLKDWLENLTDTSVKSYDCTETFS